MVLPIDLFLFTFIYVLAFSPIMRTLWHSAIKTLSTVTNCSRAYPTLSEFASGRLRVRNRILSQLARLNPNTVRAPRARQPHTRLLHQRRSQRRKQKNSGRIEAR